MRSVLAVLIGVVVVLAAGNVHAQSAGSSSIEGVVVDASGAVLPGATVVIKNEETGITRETITDSGGRFRAGALQPGRYSVTASLQGFESFEAKALTASVGNTLTVDATLRPAGVKEEITVTGASPVTVISSLTPAGRT